MLFKNPYKMPNEAVTKITITAQCRVEKKMFENIQILSQIS